MDNSNPDELRQWVSEQTAYLDPPSAWQPDADAALALMHQRMRADLRRPARQRWLAWSAAAAAIVAAFLLFSAGRVAAQLWQMLTVRQVAVIGVNPWPEDVPSPEIKLLGARIPPLPARDAAEAAWRVRYEPRLPHAGVLSGDPRLSTTFGVGAGTVIHAADLELALRKAGVENQTVPANWDGAQIGLHSSALVIAEWPEVVLLQSLPLTLTAPPGFDFAAFSALILRILGVEPEEAQRLAQQAGTTPLWLVPIDRDLIASGTAPARYHLTLEEIKLNSGPATLEAEAPGYDGRQRITLLWMVPDRVYVLNGYISRELAIATANAVQ
jgi:hypothetical protein